MDAFLSKGFSVYRATKLPEHFVYGNQLDLAGIDLARSGLCLFEPKSFVFDWVKDEFLFWLIDLDHSGAPLRGIIG